MVIPFRVQLWTQHCVLLQPPHTHTRMHALRYSAFYYSQHRKRLQNRYLQIATQSEMLVLVSKEFLEVKKVTPTLKLRIRAMYRKSLALRELLNRQVASVSTIKSSERWEHVLQLTENAELIKDVTGHSLLLSILWITDLMNNQIKCLVPPDKQNNLLLNPSRIKPRSALYAVFYFF